MPRLEKAIVKLVCPRCALSISMGCRMMTSQNWHVLPRFFGRRSGPTQFPLYWLLSLYVTGPIKDQELNIDAMATLALLGL